MPSDDDSSGRHERTTSTRWPWDSPFAWAMPPPRKSSTRWWLRRRWGEAYRITFRWWRRPDRRWTGVRRSDRREVARRTPGELLHALTADYVAEIAAEHQARQAREAAVR